MLQVGIVLFVIIFMLVSLYKDLMQPALVFLIAVLIFRFTGIINTYELLHGLANENVVLIFLLLVISEIVKKTAVVDNSINNLLKQNLKYPWFLARLSGTVALFSAFVNNTPLVAFLMPYAQDWAKKNNMSPSKVLIPLSYAAIMGGTITLVGTSTHLIVNGLYMEEGYPSLDLFDFSFIGIPATLLGIIYIYFVLTRILPERKSILTDFSEQSRKYLVETIVPPMSKLIGKNIEQAKLRNLKGLYLAQIIREEQVIAPVSTQEFIHRKDRLFFAGDTTKILDLVEGNKNLILPFGRKMLDQTDNNIVEVIISNNSKLNNSTAKTYNFRKNFDAAIIAIQRNGEKLEGKIGEIVLKTGDLLLLVAGKNFQANSKNEEDFYITSRIKKIESIPGWKKWIFFASFVAAFGLWLADIIPLFLGLLMVVGLTALINMVRFNELKKTVDLNMYIILVLALALGKAIYNSGVADMAANQLLSLFKNNPVFIMAALYIITNVLAMFITNAAAVSITFPIALAAATSLALPDVKPFILAIAIAGSASFLSPFGYQTNIMVFGPGGYKFKDFVKAGLPLAVIYLILTVWVLSRIYHLV